MNYKYSSNKTEQVLGKLETTKKGLSEFEANKRFRAHGPNELKEGKKETKRDFKYCR